MLKRAFFKAWPTVAGWAQWSGWTILQPPTSWSQTQGPLLPLPAGLWPHGDPLGASAGASSSEVLFPTSFQFSLLFLSTEKVIILFLFLLLWYQTNPNSVNYVTKNPSLDLTAHGKNPSIKSQLKGLQGINPNCPSNSYTFNILLPHPKKSFTWNSHLTWEKRITSRDFICLFSLAFKFEFYLIYGRRRRRRRWRRWWLAETFNTTNLSQNIHLEIKKVLSEWKGKKRAYQSFQLKIANSWQAKFTENYSMPLTHKYYMQKAKPHLRSRGLSSTTML